MSKSVNEVILIGNVGNDPEVRSTNSGSRIASIGLATTDGWGDNVKTNWHRLKVFGKLVGVVEEFVRKGDRLYIRGRLDYSTSGEGDTKKFWTDVVVNDLVMLGGSTPGERKAESGQADTGNLPF